MGGPSGPTLSCPLDSKSGPQSIGPEGPPTTPASPPRNRRSRKPDDAAAPCPSPLIGGYPGRTASNRRKTTRTRPTPHRRHDQRPARRAAIGCYPAPSLSQEPVRCASPTPDSPPCRWPCSPAPPSPKAAPPRR
ncbi:DUF6053 domain-containing protein [Lysobacter enzymogenes]|uniref:DUF6053 domain-containing protein n=1 Tax=Lysobacter enzymogenes TaxID=69 RepID=UPI003D187DA7